MTCDQVFLSFIGDLLMLADTLLALVWFIPIRIAIFFKSPDREGS
jgi:hypothetical protein